MTALNGLYVHIPFCSVKCFYCDFAAFSGQNKQAGRYLSALQAEARLFPERKFDTLYVGGGTPSELDAEQIDLLLAAFPGPYAESTFEGNPESLTADKLDVLKRRGVTRVSIGLQTADDALLKSVGRRHSFEDFKRVFEAAAPLDRCVDLMYGLPGQSLESLRGTLDRVLALEPEHVSLYGLQVEDRTLFAKRGVTNDEKLERDMFELALEKLSGYDHYEISNFALSGHRSAHNLNYWNDGEYVGLGCGAASHLSGVRSTNHERLQDYLRDVEAGLRPVAETESLAGKAKLGEKAFLGLRKLDGFTPGPELMTAFAASWSELGEQGLVSADGPRRKLTREGVFLANLAFKHFVAPFPEGGS
jgi:oxygen-independent coproporphyrinogen-3 oxidase